jgi:hypothetical protein
MPVSPIKYSFGAAIISALFFLICLPIAVQAQTGLFWSVVKPGSKDTSFLLGTVHKYPKTVVELPGIVGEKMDKCRNLYLEIQLDWKMGFKMLSGGSFINEMVVNEKWTKEDWEFIKEWFVDYHQMDATTFNYLKGKNKTSMSPLNDMFMELYGFDRGAVEEDLKMLAKQRKIDIRGLDKDWNEIQTWYAHYAQKSTDYWKKGSLDSLLDEGYYRLADLFIAYAIQDTATINFYEKDDEWENGLTLVAWRNHNWMPQLKKLMQNQTLVAVGAAHLYGTHGVVNLLKKAGFSVSPVEGYFGGEKLERFIRRNSRQYQLAD